MEIEVLTSYDDPYAELLSIMVKQEIPGSTAKGDCERFEATVNELVGTRRHRFGPTPSPESLVKIREIVRHCVENNVPIPVLIPWGASKQGPFGVDLAEVLAVKQINCLAERVLLHHPPGLDAVVRLEDLTDYVLFPENRQKTDLYCDILSSLFREIGNSQTNIVRESEFMEEEELRPLVNHSVPLFMTAFSLEQGERPKFLRNALPSWSGTIPDDQLKYYKSAYERFYPKKSEQERDEVLATYFSNSMAKVRLQGTGARPEWEGKFVTVSFTGIPWGHNAARVQLRTMPHSYCSSHKAPWLSKGYAKIYGREVVPSLAGWDGDGLDYKSASLLFSSDDDTFLIGSDYVVMS